MLTIDTVINRLDLDFSPATRTLLKTYYGQEMTEEERHSLPGLPNQDGGYQTLFLQADRGEGKSTIAGFIAYYEFLNLVQKDNPQTYYGVKGPLTILLLEPILSISYTMGMVRHLVKESPASWVNGVDIEMNHVYHKGKEVHVHCKSYINQSLVGHITTLIYDNVRECAPTAYPTTGKVRKVYTRNLEASLLSTAQDTLVAIFPTGTLNPRQGTHERVPITPTNPRLVTT